MRRLMVLVLLLLVGLAACGPGGVRVISPGELPADIYEPDLEAEQVRVLVYFTDGQRLLPAARTVRAVEPLEVVAMRALLAGPTDDERAQELTTEIPDLTELQAVSVRDEVVYVDLPAEFYRPGDQVGLASGVLRLAQIVWTLTDLPVVRAVQFMADGRQIDVIDQDGGLVEGPVARARYSRYQPAADPDSPDVGV